MESITATELKEIRADWKMSQAAFAQLLGVNLRTFQGYEQGRQIPPTISKHVETIQKLRTQQVNLSDQVKIRVRPQGERLWREYHEQLGLDAPPIQRDAEGYTKMQLWEVMQYFGKGLYNGCEPPIETYFYLLNRL